MPWRARYITTRRHPLAWSAYGVVFLLGLLFLLNVLDSHALNQLIGPWWQIAWQWLMVTGGAIATLGLAVSAKRLEVALTLELVGASAAFWGCVVYCMSIILAIGWSSSSWLLLGVLALGCGVRALQIRREIRIIDKLVLLGKESG